MIYDIESAIRLIKSVIANKPVLREWDDLVSLPHEDPFTKNLSNVLLGIQIAHSDVDNGAFINNEGVKELYVVIEGLEKNGAI